MPRVAILAMVLPVTIAALTACSPTVAMEPAADATNPGCADVIVHLPTSVADQPQRETNAQATSAWGQPTAVLLRCGVTPPGPSENICFTVKGVDWLRDESKAPSYVFTTYGRTPAVQVVIDTDLTQALEGDKHAPEDVARIIIDGVRAGKEEILVDDFSRAVKAGLSAEPRVLYPVA